jgi:flagellar M-ring protein FliF
MDFLNKAYAQLAELFRSMTPAARATTALLLAAVIVAGGYLFNHQMSGGNVYLLDGQHFSSEELKAIEAAFGTGRLEGYTVEGGRVRVPSGQKAKYMAAMADAGAMPASFGSHLLEAVNKPGPFTSGPQQKAMMKIAVQKELSAIIGSMQGIERAMVLYDSQKKGGLRSEETVTASVSVKPVGNLPLPANQVPKIRYLVAGAIAGLNPQQVTVADLNGRTYGGGGPDSATDDPLDDPYVQRLKAYPDLFEGRIREALAYIPGVIVKANVDLNSELRKSEQRNHVDPKAVAPLMTKDESETNVSDSGGPTGQPGFQAQQQRPNAPANLAHAPKSTHNDKDRSSRTEQNAVSTDQTTTEYASLTPKRVTVTVGIPSSFYEKIWREQNPTLPGQAAPPLDKKALEQIELAEIKKVQNTVTSLIPQVDATADPSPLVAVNTYQPLPQPEIPTTPTAEVAISWLSGHWSTLGMLALALFSLLMVRSLVRSGPPATAATSPPMSPAAAAAATAAAEASAEQKAAVVEPKDKAKLKRRLGSGQSLREELADLVREDPDTAANILRTWIGNVS